MKIKTVEINGYLSFNNFKIKLNDKNIIVGTNGVGKSNFLKLLHLAMFDGNELSKYSNGSSETPYIKIVLDPGKMMKPIRDLIKLKYLCTFVQGFPGDSKQIFYEFKYPYLDEILNMKQLTLINRSGRIEIEELQGNKLFLASTSFGPNIQEIRTLLSERGFNERENLDNTEINRKLLKLDVVLNGSKIYTDREYLSERIDGMLNANNKKEFCELFDLKFDENTLNNMDVRDRVINLIQQKITNIQCNSNMKIDNKIDEYIKGRIYNYRQHDYFDTDEIKYLFSPDYRIKHKFYKMSKNNRERFEKIQIDFNSITGKDINIKPYHNEKANERDARNRDAILNDPDNSKYVIELVRRDISLNQLEFSGYPMLEYAIGPNSYKCSTGEEELINFLVCYHDNFSSIIFIDDQCARLSSQNRKQFRRLILEKDNDDKQLIMVTHNIEMISLNTCKNIIRFNLKDNRTIHNSIPDNDIVEHQKQIKLICEHRELLFANKVLLCEGWGDYVIFGKLLNMFNIHDYVVIPLGGKDIRLWEPLDYLDIEYKAIYDCDMLYDKIDGVISEDFIEMKYRNLENIILNKQTWKIDNMIRYLKILIQMAKNKKNDLSEQINQLNYFDHDMVNSISNELILCKTNDEVKRASGIEKMRLERLIESMKNKSLVQVNYLSHLVFNNKILIWNRKLEDLEGFLRLFLSKKLFPPGTKGITKIPNDKIDDELWNHRNDPILSLLKTFLLISDNDINDIQLINGLKQSIQKQMESNNDFDWCCHIL